MGDELVALLENAPESRPASHGAREPEHELRQVHRPTYVGGDGVQEARRFVKPNGPEALHVLRAEELDDADLPHLSPVIPVRGEDDVGPVVAHDLRDHEFGPGGEGQVVGLEDGLRHVRGGGDDG
ncbi:unnamed protein product [Cuscuta europaea]|uniref:Uncharacterized protein n=1 Tax=Cuscuta europaea TaxID=41803 RepID=A0A9P0Z6B1_CUSEU|nr:unnamed protein product [Cuscuta europaea]